MSQTISCDRLQNTRLIILHTFAIVFVIQRKSFVSSFPKIVSVGLLSVECSEFVQTIKNETLFRGDENKSHEAKSWSAVDLSVRKGTDFFARVTDNNSTVS
jgi:hypothetical protein